MTAAECRERSVAALERIATAVDLLVAPPQAPVDTPPCEHPEESRIRFGVTNGVPDWQCGLCAYRTVTP